MHEFSWMHKYVSVYSFTQTFPSLVVCTRLLEINEDELTKEDSAKLEEIFHLLVNCSKTSTSPVNLSPLHGPIPIRPADRSVTQNARSNHLPSKLTFVAPCPLPKPSNNVNPHMDIPRAVHDSDYCTAVL